MEPIPESIEQLKAQVREMSQKLQSLTQDKGHKFSEKTEGILELLKKELEEKSHQAEQPPLQTALAALALGLIHEFEPKVKDTLKSATDKTVGFAGGLEAGFNEGLDKTVEATKKAGKSIQDYIKDNPWKSLAVAAALGLLLGRIASDKKKSND